MTGTTAAGLVRVARGLRRCPDTWGALVAGEISPRVETRLDRGDPEPAKTLLREARDEVKEIVVELRELVRGIHPPALDAGLEAALAALAARSPIPTTVRVDLGARPSASTETMIYFAAAELLANAGKHSLAERVRTLDGTLTASSPVGGPTMITIDLPIEER